MYKRLKRLLQVRSFVSLCKNVRTSLLSIVSEAQKYRRLKRLLQVRSCHDFAVALNPFPFAFCFVSGTGYISIKKFSLELLCITHRSY